MDRVNLTEAAELLGVHRNTLSGWLASGRIQGERVGKEWSIPTSELERLGSPDPEIMRQYSGAVSAAEMFTAWREQTEQIALADTLEAAKGLCDAWTDAAASAEGAEVVRRERMAQVEAELQRLIQATRNITRLRELHPFEKALRAHAIQLGREVDEDTDLAIAATRALAAQK